MRKSCRKTKLELEEEEHRLLEQVLEQSNDEGLRVEDIPCKGRGVIACRQFHKGDFVVEYAGKILTRDEAELAEETYSKDLSTGSYMFYFRHKDRQFCIDATEESGRLGRLVNHSLDGNCKPRVIEINGCPRLAFFALKDIHSGDELLFDYGERRPAVLESFPWLKVKSRGLNFGQNRAEPGPSHLRPIMANSETERIRGNSLFAQQPDPRHPFGRQHERQPIGTGVDRRSGIQLAQEGEARAPAHRLPPFTPEEDKEILMFLRNKGLEVKALQIGTWRKIYNDEEFQGISRQRPVMSVYSRYRTKIFTRRSQIIPN